MWLFKLHCNERKVTLWLIKQTVCLIRNGCANIIGKVDELKNSGNYSTIYDEYGETTEYQRDEDNPFYNEICYTAGVYDATTGLYNLNARYYSPAAGTFLTQDTYRGSRSRTSTLNYYAYCAGNPISYTDPSGHAFLPQER